MKNNKNFKRGFTLLELLIVILIIGILAAIALPQYNMAVMKSRYATMMNVVNTLNEAEERYYLIHDKYVSTFDGLDIDLECKISSNPRYCSYSWGYCAIELGTSTDRVHCQNTQNLNNGYVQYLQFGHHSSWGRTCWALTTDRKDKYNKLCELMGAKYHTSGTCTADGCKIYKF